MGGELCSRCGRHRLDCACQPDPASPEWSTERAYSHGENVVSLRDHRRRRDWNRHVRDNPLFNTTNGRK